MRRLSIVALLVLAGCQPAHQIPSRSSAGARQMVVAIRETAGLDRVMEPVEIPLWPTPAEWKGGVIVRDARSQEVLPFCQVDGGKLTLLVDIKGGGERTIEIVETDRREKGPVTDLVVTGDGYAPSVENSHYRLELDPKSGQINTLTIKGGTNAPLSFAHGPVHWNPDICGVKPYAWYYTHSWNPPEKFSRENGPIVTTITRSGNLPREHTEGKDIHRGVRAEVVYRFYAYQPWFLMESMSEATDDLPVWALRNDEMAFKQEFFTHFVWKYPDGSVHRLPVEKGQEKDGGKLAENPLWIGLVNDRTKDGYGSIRLAFDATNVLKANEPATTHNAGTFLRCHSEGVYWFRGWVYVQGRGPDREHFVTVAKGSRYTEKNAYLVFPYEHEGSEAIVEQIARRLKHPLQVRAIE